MKRDGRKLAHNTLEEMRVLAVQRMNEGEHPGEVAASLGMHRSWGYKCRAMAKGRGRGLRALRSTKGTGRPRKLTPAQERQVFRWVNGKRPDQYGFDFGLWTRQVVRELVLERFEVSLSLASIGALLARLGLTAQKPLERAYQRDPDAVARWKNETYPAIASEAQGSRAEILFWDESGFRADPVHGKTWAPRGKTTGGRTPRATPKHQCRIGRQRQRRFLVCHLQRRLDGGIVRRTAQDIDAPAQKTGASGGRWIACAQVSLRQGICGQHPWQTDASLLARLCARPQSRRIGMEPRQADGCGALTAEGG